MKGPAARSSDIVRGLGGLGRSKSGMGLDSRLYQSTQLVGNDNRVMKGDDPPEIVRMRNAERLESLNKTLEKSLADELVGVSNLQHESSLKNFDKNVYSIIGGGLSAEGMDNIR